MKRRRNPDDDIRKLERKALQTLAKADILRYWRACLRAGEIPKPTYEVVGPEEYLDGLYIRRMWSYLEPGNPTWYVGEPLSVRPQVTWHNPDWEREGEVLYQTASPVDYVDAALGHVGKTKDLPRFLQRLIDEA